MDATKLVELGTNIARISTELSKERAMRDEAQGRVLALEAELMPLLAEHATLIAGLVGTVSAAVAAPVAAFAQPVPGGPPAAAEGLPPGVAPPGLPAARPGPSAGANSQLKARVFEYLKRLDQDEPIAASDIAEVLRIDAVIVREALLELRNGRR